MTASGGNPRQDSDAAKAMRFMAVKAAVFILLPLLISLVAVYFTLR